jgi:hypothetical protein
MTNHEQLRAVAEAATPEMKEWFNLDEQGWCYAGEAYDAQTYIAAASPDVVLALLTDLDALRTLVTKLHAAKGRYHSQIAACNLFDAVGLKNERPVK